MSSPTRKLKLADVKFYDRQAELQQLQFAWDKVISEEDARIVLIRGYAGTGKSRLVDTFQGQLVKQRPAQYVIRGKFDEHTATVPFSSLADAFSEFCSQLLAKEPEEELAVVKQSILGAVGSEGRALTNAIPGLVKILGEQPVLQQVSLSTAKNRLQYHFQAFVESICSVNRPIVLILDDLQWADAASLNLVMALLTDCKLKHFLFLGSYRDNEVDSLHPLAEKLDIIREKGTSFLSIHIGNLNVGSTTDYIADALQLEPVEVAELALGLYAKTAGNMYYTRMSLLLLEQKGILKYSYQTYRWEWELARLATDMGVSQNVADLTIQSLQTLPEELQRALSIAAFLQTSFDLGTLQHLVVAESNAGEDVEPSTHPLQQLLEIAVVAGFLENAVGTQKYRFAHDRIREAAHSLVPALEKEKTMLRIGECLVRLSSNASSGEEWMLFAGIDKVNSLPMDVVKDVFDLHRLIELNHVAGTKAAARSAYSPAASYLQKALEIISTIPLRWESHYELCLDLYVFAANVDFCIGKFDRAHRSLDEVLSQAKSERDKLQAYVSLAEGLGLRERHEEALEMDLKAMAIISDFPKWFLPVHLIRAMNTLKSTFRKKTDDEIMSLPVLEDKDKLLALKILSSMWSRAYLCQKMAMALLCMTRALCTTLQYGLSPPGALAFAAYGSLLCGPLADYKTGVRLGELSHKILQHTRGKEFESRILFTAAVHIDAWVTPLSIVQDILHRGYLTGMETGDTEFAFFSSAFFNAHAYMMGLPLGPVIEESESLIHQINEYGVESVRAIVVPFHQMLLYLSGRTEDPLAWIHGMEGQGSRRRKAHDPSETVKFIWSYIARGQLAYYLGETAAADQTWTKLKPLLAGMSSYCLLTLDIYFTGLIGTAMFRKTGKRKYRDQAQTAVKSMKSLMEKFNTGLNNLHRYYIMKADVAAACEKKSKDEVREAFDQAISASSKAGFLQDAALANELCGEFFAKGENLYWAKHYLTSAYNGYCEWGAEAKSAHLLRDRGVFIDKEQVTGLRSNPTLRKGPLSTKRLLSNMSMTLDDMALDGTTLDGSSSGHLISLTPS
jgi:predicted ATPase